MKQISYTEKKLKGKHFFCQGRKKVNNRFFDGSLKELDLLWQNSETILKMYILKQAARTKSNKRLTWNKEMIVVIFSNA